MKIFVGWDSREDIAYQVCKHSILKHTNAEVEVIPLKQHKLKQEKIYRRERDTLSSTEFTFTRFLVPYLMNYQGWALFVDCDFLFLDDIEELFKLADPNYAVMVVKHNYQPKEGLKMDGKQQLPYPRKNWSSLVLWNCGHIKNQNLTLEVVNTELGSFLHRFTWLDDSDIGEIHHEWNWLVNWYKEPTDGKPKALHYTEGGPWFDNYVNCEYGALWEREKSSLEIKKIIEKNNPTLNHLPESVEELFNDLINFIIDPYNNYYSLNKDDVIKKMENLMGNKVAAIESEVISKNRLFDGILECLALSCNGYLSTWDKEESKDSPLIIRGLGGSSRKAIHHCWKTGRTFYAIDTGYFGNHVKLKEYHRLTKNSLQHLGPIVERPFDRLSKIGYKFKKFTTGSKILICPPSEKVMKLFDQDLDVWVTETVEKIKRYTSRPIELRLKGTRSERTTINTIEQALADDVHCLVTFNSIAATEAIMYGKPAFTTGPNAAACVTKQNLEEIDSPYYPSKDEVMAFMAHLSYCQFTVEELKNGYAWRTVNESHSIP